MEGKTIEIISTDAEGRMALADAIGYAKRFKPSAIIDIATLTGACVIALGGEAIAMMGNNESLMEAVQRASEDTRERAWKMPLFEEYEDTSSRSLPVIHPGFTLILPVSPGQKKTGPIYRRVQQVLV
jgi:leucyl aminopeptidase